MSQPGDSTVNSRMRDRSGELAAVGELDMSAAFRLESEFDQLVALGHVRTVVLDLAGVSFVDSAGLGALLSIRERAAQLRVELQLARPSAPVSGRSSTPPAPSAAGTAMRARR